MKSVMPKKKNKEENNGNTFMALTPGLNLRSPFSELDNIQNRLNRLVSLSGTKWPQKENSFLPRIWSPALDIIDSKSSIHVKADVPGMSRGDLSISVEGNVLMIKGEKKKVSEVKEKNYFKSERIFGGFNRIVSLPSEVDGSKAQAKYKDGVLELILPKRGGVKHKIINISVK